MNLKQSEYHTRDISGCTKTALQEFVYDYPWEQVVSSYMMRFPKHPSLPVLMHSEVISDTVNEATGVRVIVRKAELEVDAPGWFKKAIGLYSLTFTQTTYIDFKARSMRIVNYNETYSGKAMFGDECEYRAITLSSAGNIDVPFKDQKTKFEQYAYFQLPRFPLAKMAESLMAKSYGAHTAAGRQLDIQFVKDAIAPGGTWDQLIKDKGVRDIRHMPAYRVEAGVSQKEALVSSKRKSKIVRKSTTDQNAQEVITKSEGDIFNRAEQQQPDVESQQLLIKLMMFPWTDYIIELKSFGAGCLLVLTLPHVFFLKSVLLISLLIQSGTLILLALHCLYFAQFWRQLAVVVFDIQSAQADAANTVVHSQVQTPALQVNDKPVRPLNISTPSAKRQSAQSFGDGKVQSPQSEQQLKLMPNAGVGGGAGGASMRKSSLTDLTEAMDENDSDSENDWTGGVQNATEQGEEESDVEYESEEDFEDDDAAFTFFKNSMVSLIEDPELGDLNSIKLRDIQVSIPAFVEKPLTGSNAHFFVIEVVFANGLKKSVERLYTDFQRLKKFFGRTIPQCKVQLAASYLPNKKKSDPTARGMAIDYRRQVLEQYLKGLLTDEAVGKLGSRVVIEFLKHKGPLFPPSLNIKETAKKKLFGSSFSGSSVSSADGHSASPTKEFMSVTNLKVAILLKVRWRTSLRETKVTLDRASGLLSVHCHYPDTKDAHCVVSMDEVQQIVALKDNVPIHGEKYECFMIMYSQGKQMYFCSTREVVEDWISCLEKAIQQFKENASRNIGKFPMNRSNSLTRKKSSRDITSVNNSKLILNHRRFLFSKQCDAVQNETKLSLKFSNQNPCSAAVSLLSRVLQVYQLFTDEKFVYTHEVQKAIQDFNDDACQLQIIDLSTLETHSQQLSFWVNIYHTLVIHSHLEYNFAQLTSSFKRLRSIYRSLCYDINNMIFSIQDIEHCVLRAKMSRPNVVNNAMFTQSMSPRFAKRDVRAKYVLTKPDLRLNFVLNNGSKSAIYNVWVFSDNAELMNRQLDHTSTHFLNEQVQMDLVKRIIYLPRICQYYSGDLGGNKLRIFKTLTNYMSPQMEKEVKWLLKNEKHGGKIKIRYLNYDSTTRGVFFRGHSITDGGVGSSVKDSNSNTGGKLLCSLINATVANNSSNLNSNSTG
ncbi:hypothetical protein MP228_001528 [Amoeboaphelidium protococcarum]|nr:hypothetical protein MP228_001528 [Amoeboaphelidium protococcarum]